MILRSWAAYWISVIIDDLGLHICQIRAYMSIRSQAACVGFMWLLIISGFGMADTDNDFDDVQHNENDDTDQETDDYQKWGLYWW